MTIPPMHWQLFAACTAAGLLGGAIFGLVRGLDYLPTLPFAVIEGAILFAVPAALLGLILMGVWTLHATRQRHTP